MKKFGAVLAFVLIVSLLLAACGNLGNVKSELVGTFYFDSQQGSRTITFKGNGTYYDKTITILGEMEETGTYEVKKDQIILTSDEGYSHTWTYNYNKDNGNLVLYYLDCAYTKVK